MKLIMTVDLGTSGPKVALFDTTGKLVGYEFEEVPLLLFENGGVEQRPSDWLNSIKKAYSRLILQTKVDPKGIIAINCTAQWSGTVAVDSKGNVLMNSVIWMDTRGTKYVKKLVDGLIKIDGYNVLKIMKWLQITGGAPNLSGKDPIGHILYIQNELPEIYSKTHQFLEPKDFLNLYFSGRSAASYDSITLHWLTDNRDINHIQYHDGLIRDSGIDREKLPDLVPTNSILGKIRKEIAAEFGLAETVQIISGAGDIHTAAVGSGAVKDFEAHLYIGTSSWLVCHTPHKKVDVLHNMGTIPAAIPGKYIIANEQQTTGACLEYLRTKLFHPDDALESGPAPKDFYKRVDTLVKNTPAGSGGMIFLPWLNGERSPFDDRTTRGGFFNLSLKNTRGDLCRSVFEGVAFNSRWLLGYVEKLAGKKFQAINFIGGAANSSVWSQIIADIYDRPIRAMKDPLISNSRGTALLALVALGMLKIEDISKSVEVRETFHPNPKNRTLYDETYESFLEIYKRNKSIFAKLNRKNNL